MSEPVAPPPPPGPPASPSGSSQATTALVVGILSFVCCNLAGPIAWWLGRKEIDAIKAGQSPEAGQGLAMAGMILGIVATILLAFGLLWVLFFGGMAVLSALAQSAGR